MHQIAENLRENELDETKYMTCIIIQVGIVIVEIILQSWGDQNIA